MDPDGTDEGETRRDETRRTTSKQRWACYDLQHAIVAHGAAERISVTFRQVVPSQRAKFEKMIITPWTVDAWRCGSVGGVAPRRAAVGLTRYVSFVYRVSSVGTVQRSLFPRSKNPRAAAPRDRRCSLAALLSILNRP